MSNLKGILVELVTQDTRGADTDDHLYLGVVGTRGGREFALDVKRFNDFERGTTVTYWLGDIWQSGVAGDARRSRWSEPGERNDPGLLRIGIGDVNYVYLRKTGTVGSGGDDTYGLDSIQVRLYGTEPDKRSFHSSGGVFLGDEFGHQVWLEEADEA